MADTGWLSPAATGETYNEWSNPTNAYTSNNQYASSESGNTRDQQDYYNFGISVPAGSTIDGIEVSVEGAPYSIKNPNFSIKLSWDAGSSWTSTQDTGSYSSEAYKSVGGSSDDWDHSWSISELGNSYFRLYIENIGDSAVAAYPCCDHIRIKVYYTAGSVSSSSISVSVTKSSFSISVSQSQSSSIVSVSQTKSSTSSQSATKSSSSISISMSVSWTVSSSSISVSGTKSSASSSSISVSKSSDSSASVSVSKSSSFSKLSYEPLGNVIFKLTWGAQTVSFYKDEVDRVEIKTVKQTDLQRLQNRQPIVYELGTSWKTLYVTFHPHSKLTWLKLEHIRKITDIMTLTTYYSDGTTQSESLDVRIDPILKTYFLSGLLDAAAPINAIFYEAAAS